MNAALAALPSYPTDRWRPTRAGLLSVWRYVEETFEFHRGRLLLRGPNGAGKSMALELLLPFLLDADASPGRLTSAAKSRGGLFDRVMTGSDEASRTGYVWVEFRRGTDTFTIGARMRASQSTRKVDTDYFTTSQAIGLDLHLMDQGRVPLSLKDLKEAIGPYGRVHGSAEEHRAAVRATLYEGFGADRYASVVTALLALRKEKLSQNLDLEKLSDVLSEALPPIDDHDIAAVAEGFERLDRRRAQLDALRTELQVVEALQARQRHYARSVLAWLADEVRSAESARDTITRRARAAAEQLTAERIHLDTHITATDERDAAVEGAATEMDALVRSDAYREGANLADLREQLSVLAHAVERADELLTQASEGTDAAERRLDVALEQQATAHSNLDQALGDLRDASSCVGAGGLVEDITELAAERTTTHDAEAVVRAYTTTRLQAVDEVRALLQSHRDAIRDRDARTEQVDHDTTRLDEAIAQIGEARAEVDAAIERYGWRVGEWARSCDTIGVERVLSALSISASEPALVVASLARLRADLQAEHAVTRERLDQQQQVQDEVHDALKDEREHFAQGTLVEPEAPTWRAERAGRPGAPLWRVVDVLPGTPTDRLDGIEAALVASGLADAWVQPDGTVDVDDTRVDLTLTTSPVTGTTLQSILRPLAGAGVEPAVVAGVLASVEVTPSVSSPASEPVHGSRVVIGADGTFRLGAAVGRGRVVAAGLLGAEAREQRRLARLVELDAAIAANRAEHRAVGEKIASSDRHHAAEVAELDAAPGGDEVDTAREALGQAEQQGLFAETRLVESREHLRTADEAVRDHFRRLTSVAAHHDVPTDAGSLDVLSTALRRIDDTARTWAARWRDHDRASTQVAREQEDHIQAVERQRLATEGFEATQRDHRRLDGTVAALASTVGAAYDDVLTRLQQLREQHAIDRKRLRKLRDERPRIDQAIGNLEATVQRAEEERQRAEQVRVAAHVRFVSAVRRGLATDAEATLPDDLDGVTAVLAAARDLAAQLYGVADDRPSRDRASSRVEEQLHQTRQQLGGRVDLDRAPTDDGWSDLTALSGGVRRRIGDLAAALHSELASAADELHAEEEQLFARVLAGEIRRALAERIRHANGLVDQINAQLGQVRTKASDVHVRLSWDVDPEQPDAVRAARALLLHDPSDLTDAQTAALQDFVRARVEQARAELESTAPWDARLRATLDYRSWHRFTLLLAHRDWEGHRKATPARLQRLSTGERSIALHLPMLASIAAHYTGPDGQPATCPRLILLDELFAGVDPANRSQLFARFTEWDLDAVFTSDHEWCQYATLDGIAVHHLHPPTATEPVTSTRFTWDGHQRQLDPNSPSAA